MFFKADFMAAGTGRLRTQRRKDLYHLPREKIAIVCDSCQREHLCGHPSHQRDLADLIRPWEPFTTGLCQTCPFAAHSITCSPNSPLVARTRRLNLGSRWHWRDTSRYRMLDVAVTSPKTKMVFPWGTVNRYCKFHFGSYRLQQLH